MKKVVFILIILGLVLMSCIPINHPPTRPSNPSPSNGATDISIAPTLSWEASDPDGDTLTYNLYLSTESSPELYQEGIETNSIEVGPLENGITYYWRVEALDGKGGVSSSPVWSFKTGNYPPTQPSNPTPNDGATDVSLTLTLSWEVSDPDGDTLIFDIYLGTDSNPPLLESDLSTNTYSPDKLESATTYYWKIIAKDGKGGETEGPVWSFTTGNKLPTQPSDPIPSDGATNVSLTPKLFWKANDPDGDTLTFDIYFGTEPNPPLIESDLATNNYNPGTLNLATTYYWKIIAKDGKGGFSSSPIWSFTTTNAPTQPSNPVPSNGETDVPLNPTLSWEASDPDGDSLTFDVYFGVESNPPLVESDLFTNTFTPEKLNSDTTYYWKIIAKDGKGGETEGPVWSFTTLNNAPTQPSNPIPSDGATDVSLTPNLSWDSSDPDGDTLTFDVYLGIDSNPPLVESDLSTNTYNPGTLNSKTTYYWKIVVKDGKGGETEGPVWSFTTLNNAPTQPTNPVPSDGATGVSITQTLSWDASDPDGDLITYDLYLSKDASPKLYQEGIETNSIEIGPLEYGMTYYWRVVAKDGKGGTSSSPVWSFTTENINFIVAANGEEGIVIFDVNDAKKPFVIGYLDTDGYAYDVYISDNYAYVADDTNGLVILDVSDPSNPGQVGHFDTDGYAQSVYISDNYAYIADHDNGLVIIDISDPSNPSFVGHYDTSGWAEDVYVSGNYAYIADYDNGLVIIDISNPSNPSYEGHYFTSRYAQGLFVSGSYAYISDYSNGLVIIDISYPPFPRLAGKSIENRAREVFISGNYAYIANDIYGLIAQDISDPFNPKLVGYLDTDGDAFDVYVSGNYAYIADAWDGLVIVDITDPTNLKKVGHFDTEGQAYGIYVSDNYAYVADYSNGLLIFDVSNPTNPRQEGHFDTEGFAYDVYVSGNYAYLADGRNGLVIIDITDPTNPELIGHFDTEGFAYDVYVSGSLVYIADYSRGLVIVDVTNPANPEKVGQFDTEGYAYDVYVSGNYAYVADDTNGLVILDVSDPSNPSSVSHLNEFYARGICISDNYAYIAGLSSGLVIVDITNQLNPVTIWNVPPLTLYGLSGM